ncbi:serine/threonine-protein kinase HAL4/sat4 [Podila epigama]|nr:serine/threonine-protein kinase HAL4/sat4 [Podila epigama]
MTKSNNNLETTGTAVTTPLEQAVHAITLNGDRNHIDTSLSSSSSSPRLTSSQLSAKQSSASNSDQQPAAPTVVAVDATPVQSQEPLSATCSSSPTSSKASSPVSPPQASSQTHSQGSSNHTRQKSHTRNTHIPSTVDLHPPSAANSRSTSPSRTPSVPLTPIESKHRFEVLPNGSHVHHLSAPKREQFLMHQMRRVWELLEGKKDKGHHQRQHHHGRQDAMEDPLSLFNKKLHDIDGNRPSTPESTHSHKKHSVEDDFVSKYGELHNVIGKGACGVIRLAVKKNPETGEEINTAVKEFTHDHGESQRTYMRRLTSEFCIASSLKHINVIDTMDLVQLHGDTFSEVMEYCSGGDLHSLIASADTLDEAESACFFAQLLNGVSFLHSMGVAHRDLKPENLLLTEDGNLKIADFGNSEVFRMPWENKARSSTFVRGSGPFIAPEEFTTETFDARKVDMWACGIIYMCMRLGQYTWHEASEGDPIWDSFLYKVEHFWKDQETKAMPVHPNLTAIEQSIHTTLAWPSHIADVIEHLLEPNPRKRWQVTQALDSEWMKHVDNCHPTERVVHQRLDESEFDPVPSHQVGSRVLEQASETTGCKIVKDIKSHNDTVKASDREP